MKNLIILLIFSQILISKGQNLVQNSGFENHTALPTTFGQWNLVSNWSNANASFASPDYLHTSGSGLVQLPNSVFGTINPFQGNAIMGICVWHSNTANFREYISQNLSSPLVVGNSYTFSFYLANGVPGNYGGMGIKNIQVDFSVNPINQLVYAPLGYTPLLSASSIIYSANWTQLSFTFTATAPYNNFAIGNFKDDANTVTQQFVATGTPTSYYFIDNVSLTLNNENPIFITGDSLICRGDSTTLTANNVTSYAWADSINPSITISTNSVITVSPSVSTTYYLYSNTDTTSYKVNVINIGNLWLGNDTILCENDFLVLDVFKPNASYLWQNNSTSSTFTITEPGTYWTEITINNCKNSDSINVEIKDCEVNLELPNVFTPNNDGTNDYFIATKIKGINQASLTIYNRWGQKMMETSDLLTGWDGKFNNLKCPTGTYFWTVQYMTIKNESKTLTGFLTLIN